MMLGASAGVMTLLGYSTYDNPNLTLGVVLTSWTFPAWKAVAAVMAIDVIGLFFRYVRACSH